MTGTPVSVVSVIAPPLRAHSGFGTIVSDDHPRERTLNRYEELRRENEALRERLFRLGQASIRITEDLDLDTFASKENSNSKPCSHGKAR